jgi:hypothetical protein
MNRVKRRSKYQYGTLTLEKRSRGPDVWVYRFVEFEAGRKPRRKTIVGTREQYPTRAAAERASEHLRLSANPETFNPECPTMGGLVDRYIGQILRPCLDANVLPVREVLHVGPEPLGPAASAGLPASGIQQACGPGEHRGMATFLMALAEEPQGACPKMVRSIWNVMKLAFKFAVKWGYLNENPMGEKRVELPRGSIKRQKQPVQLTAAGFFLFLSHLGACEKLAASFAG